MSLVAGNVAAGYCKGVALLAGNIVCDTNVISLIVLAAVKNHGQPEDRSVLLATAETAVLSSAPVAQLDRALPSGGRGQRFESSRVRQ